MKKASFLDFSIKKIKQLYAQQELSPMDVALMCIDRYRATESRYHSWVCFDEESLLEQANNIQDRLCSGGSIRNFEGIPIGVKDVFNTTGFPCQMGSEIWKNFTPGNDARVVYNLKQAGAIVPGKTVTAEFAIHSLDKTRNPYDARRTPGTSSSGSAVSVASGVVPFALGTQTAGSTIRPASFNGVFGIKPSFGLLPRTGALKTTDTLDSIGYFVSHAEDIKLAFDVLRVHGLDYPINNLYLDNEQYQRKKKGDRWKVAFVKTYTWQLAEEYAKNSLIKFVDDLSRDSDVEVHEIELPSVMNEAHSIHTTIYDKSLAYYFKEEYEQKDLISETTRSLIESGKKISLDKFKRALSLQNSMIKVMNYFFNDFDILISLSTAGCAPLRGVAEKNDPCLIWTLAHLPVVNIPMFFSTEGLPFGLQIASRKYRDYFLFNFIEYMREKRLIPSVSNSFSFGQNEPSSANLPL